MQKILDIVSDVLGRPASVDMNVDNTENWDSLKTLQIVMALDEAGYSISLEKIAEIKSVSDIVRFTGGVSSA